MIRAFLETSIDFIFLSFLFIFLYLILKKKWILVVYFLFFLIVSTGLVPKILVKNVEANFQQLNSNTINKKETYTILVLGSGYTQNNRLSYTSQLNENSLSREIEGLRISKKIEKVTIVTSGFGGNYALTHAEVMKKSLLELGLSEPNIYTLNKPETTFEEAKAYSSKFGKKTICIIVTDAMHMPRAIEIFKDQGIKVLAAPTNFLVKEEIFNLELPNLRSINLFNVYLKTKIKHINYKFFIKQ
jgi:uncharacterized SAM-binding protein YcdF (DUF218 family)